MPTWRRARILCAAVLVATLTSACTAKVGRFVVKPSHTCAGTPVTLDMSVTGKATVTTDPPLEPVSRRTYQPRTTTHFVVAVEWWLPPSKDGSETEVTVMPGDPPRQDELTANVACQGGVLVGTLLRSVDEWDPRLTVETVESGEDRDVTVRHEGRQAHLTPRQPSTRIFEGTSPAGEWIMSSPLLGHERCGSTPPPPNLLNVSAVVTCGGDNGHRHQD
jgi:hypothetical protein